MDRKIEEILKRNQLSITSGRKKILRYALCKDNCSGGHHHDDHVHFICSACGNTVCLEGISVPAIQLPKGFTSEQVEMLVSGVCGSCNS
jgi:Fur family ferric uptake transcriptional regulator